MTNKPTQSLAENFYQVKAMLNLLPDDIDISITTAKGEEEWKVLLRLPNTTIPNLFIPISDNLPFVLNKVMGDVFHILLGYYNRTFQTHWSTFKEVECHCSETKQTRELMNTIADQQKEIEKMREHIEKNGQINFGTPDVSSKIHKEPEQKPLPTNKRKYSMKKRKKRKVVLSGLVKDQMAMFMEWEGVNPTKSNRGILTSDILLELVRMGVSNLEIFIAWRIAVYKGGKGTQITKGKISDGDRHMFKKAKDRIYHRVWYQPKGVKMKRSIKPEQAPTKKEGYLDSLLTKFNLK